MGGLFRKVFPRYEASKSSGGDLPATARSGRPWFRRKGITIPVGVLAVLWVIGALAGPAKRSTTVTRTIAGETVPAVTSVPPTTVFPDPVTKTSLCRLRGALPDHACTPGALNPAVTQATLSQTICSTGYTATIRPAASESERLKAQAALAYGIADPLSTFQGDHLIPLELGGAADDIANFWDQPNSLVLPDGTLVTSSQKDALENTLRDQVCTGKLLLVDAQRQVATDWLTSWTAVGRPGAATSTSTSSTTTSSTTSTSTTTVARTVTTVTNTTVATTSGAVSPPATGSTNCPNGTYINVSGNTVCSPYAAPAPPPGATAICNDGTYSMSQHRQGTCSSHGGVKQFLVNLP